MTNPITNIIPTIKKVNGIIAACNGDTMPFEQALTLAQFYYDFQDTNALIAEAEAMAMEKPAGLKEAAFSLKAETAKLLNNRKAP